MKDKERIKELENDVEYQKREATFWRKQMDLCNTLWAIFAFGVIAVIIGISFYHDIFSPTYTIYKTECHNETRLLYQKVIEVSWFKENSNISSVSMTPVKDVKVKVNDRDVLMSCVPYRVKVEDNSGLIIPQQTDYSVCDFYVYKEVCNPTEVDEIVSVNPSCVSHSPSQEYAIFNCISTINKKDLDDSWLETHCGCQKSRCPAGIQSSIQSECYWQTKENTNKYCDVWKCGNVEVEVK